MEFVFYCLKNFQRISFVKSNYFYLYRQPKQTVDKMSLGEQSVDEMKYCQLILKGG